MGIQGKSENTYIIKTLNKSQSNKLYFLQTSADSKVDIMSPTQFEVAAGQLHIQVITVADKQAVTIKDQHKLINFKITDTNTGEEFIKVLSFYQSDEGW